jgi:hypothetical protein
MSYFIEKSAPSRKVVAGKHLYVLLESDTANTKDIFSKAA